MNTQLAQQAQALPPQLAKYARIAGLLAAGASQRLAAGVVGISEQSLSAMLRDDPRLQSALMEAQQEVEAEDLEYEQRVRELRQSLIEKGIELVGEVASTREALQCLTLLEQSRPRQGQGQLIGIGIGQGQDGKGAGSGVLVQINLSAIAQQRVNLRLDEKNAIISVGDRNMATLPFAATRELLASPIEEHQDEHQYQHYPAPAQGTVATEGETGSSPYAYFRAHPDLHAAPHEDPSISSDAKTPRDAQSEDDEDDFDFF